MQKFLFDGENKLFIAKPGVTSVDVQVDLYSAYKQEILIGDNSKWPEAIRTAGGDPIGGGVFVGAFFFLMNGFKIRPQEADHILVLNGNLFLDDGETGDIVVPTLGDYNVMVRQVVSSIVNVVQTSGSSPSAIATAVWDAPVGSTAAELLVMAATASGLPACCASLSSSIAELSGSIAETYNVIFGMSGSTVFVSSSMIELSSSLSSSKECCENVYTIVTDISSSVGLVSGSVEYISGSMVSLSASNEAVCDAVMEMSSSVDFVSGSVYFLSSSMISVSSSNVQVYDATIAMSSSVADVYTIVQSNEDLLISAAISSSVAVVSASIAANYASIAAVSASIAAEKTYVLEKAEFGRWKISNNQMVFYALDNVTPLVTFNLYDADGNPTMTNVFERVPV